MKLLSLLFNERNEVEKEYNKIKNSLVLLVKKDPRRFMLYKKEIETIDIQIQRLGFKKTSLEDLTKKREDAAKRLEIYNNVQSESAQLARLVKETQSRS